jgi:hypothetical protein
VPLPETMTWADIPEGTRVAVEVEKATYQPDNQYGPQFEVDLQVLKPGQYAGEQIRSWLSLSQPRLGKVRDLRSQGVKDAAIREALEEKGFEFTNIDDPEEPRLGGGVKRAVRAGTGNDPRAYRELVDSCDTFDELAAAMVGLRLTVAIRHDKEGRSKVDGNADFLPYVETKPVGNPGGHNGGLTAEDEEDFAKIPF